ncbi:tetratricopeptide repeat protein [Roseixanthobacter pseudopolyaromaticivorans]
MSKHSFQVPAARGSSATRRALVMAFACALALALCGSYAAHAQVTGEKPPAGATKPNGSKPDAAKPAPNAGAADATPARPKLPRDRRVQLDAMFEALRLAPDDETASALGSRIEAMFAQSGSASADLLMSRAEAATQAKEYDLALELLGTVIETNPDFLAARSRRATIYYLQDDYASALVDVGEVLTREPRHYSMLLGLSLIMREIGDDTHALEAARRALAVNPHLTAAKDIESELKIKVEGRDI